MLFTKTLDDILGVFNRAKTDLDKFIQDHRSQIAAHDDDIFALNAAKTELVNVKARAGTVLENITKFLSNT